jgi:hypothetical protein
LDRTSLGDADPPGVESWLGAGALPGLLLKVVHDRRLTRGELTRLL